MAIPNKSIQQIGSQMYHKLLIDHTAGFLFAVSEMDSPEQFNHQYNWYRNFANKYDGEEHSGDCTQQPWSCSQCIIDDYRERALSIINTTAFNQYLIDEELCLSN